MTPGDLPPLRSWEGATAVELAERWAVPAVRLYGEVGSTNDVARAWAERGAPDGALVLAEHQTAGRGRSGRSWESPAGLGLWCSLVVRRHARVGTELLPLLVGVGTARGLDAFVGAGLARIKWPNDLIVAERKLGGILCEASWQADHPVVIAGIGINVYHSPEDFPPELRASAISVAEAAVAPAGRIDLMDAILGGIRPLLARPADRLPAEVAAELERRDALRGRIVEASIGGGDPVTGTALGIAPDGALLLRSQSGALRTVRSGSVRVVNGSGHLGSAMRSATSF
jgi:BirA family transcriptional regulator, biotin operon repressor / biotin---[acetyl-CoA-carboxylase] ligase